MLLNPIERNLLYLYSFAKLNTYESHSGHMQMISEDKFLELFIHYGLEPERLKEGGSKSPDFVVKKDSRIRFYCEVKNIDIDLNLCSGLSKDPIYNTISTHIHNATKQLKTVNPNREFFNVIGFYN